MKNPAKKASKSGAKAKWMRDYPSRRGWYLVRKSNGELAVRAFGNGMWWTDLGRGSGKDGWLGHGTDPAYEWIGYVGDVFKDKPSVPQAVRNLPAPERNVVMSEAADVYVEVFREHRPARKVRGGRG